MPRRNASPRGKTFTHSRRTASLRPNVRALERVWRSIDDLAVLDHPPVDAAIRAASGPSKKANGRGRRPDRSNADPIAPERLHERN
jgi:hypothetical protein